MGDRNSTGDPDSCFVSKWHTVIYIQRLDRDEVRCFKADFLKRNCHEAEFPLTELSSIALRTCPGGLECGGLEVFEGTGWSGAREHEVHTKSARFCVGSGFRRCG